MLVATLVLALLVGLSLGLLGGGGSVLAVPILTFVAGMPPKQAIASSLLVVAVTSAAGALAHARAGRVRWRIGATFGAAGMIGSYAGGRAAALLPGRALLVLFALMMLGTAIVMLRGRRGGAACELRAVPLSRAVVHGVLVGALSGLVGAGGGFLVVPALALLGGLAIQSACATSLLVIAMQASAGLAGHLGHVDLDWPVTLAVTASALIGSFAGAALAHRVSPLALRRGFGALVLVVAVWVLARALIG